MKTFAKTLLAAAAAVTASATAQAGFQADFPQRSASFYGTPGAACANGSCGHIQHLSACPQCGSTDGTCDCRFGECANGVCGLNSAHGTRGTTLSHTYTRPAIPRSAATYAPTSQPYYTGYTPSATCPGGVCPKTPATTYSAGYRPLPAMNCANGTCRPMPYPQARAQAAPRFNFLGLNW